MSESTTGLPSIEQFREHREQHGGLWIVTAPTMECPALYQVKMINEALWFRSWPYEWDFFEKGSFDGSTWRPVQPDGSPLPQSGNEPAEPSTRAGVAREFVIEVEALVRKRGYELEAAMSYVLEDWEATDAK